MERLDAVSAAGVGNNGLLLWRAKALAKNRVRSEGTDALCFPDNNDDDEGIRTDMNFNRSLIGKFSSLVVILKEMLTFKNCTMANQSTQFLLLKNPTTNKTYPTHQTQNAFGQLITP